MGTTGKNTTRIDHASRIPLLKEYLHGRKKKNAVFIWIPKTAGTSVYSCLDAPKLKTINQVKDFFAGNGIVTFGHMDYSELVKRGYISRQFDESAYKFAFVRNPYDRAVSLFFYLKKHNFYLKEPEKRSASVSFLTFCRGLIEKGCEPIGLYNVFKLSQCNPQIRWIEDIEMDFIGKVESIEKDSDVVFGDLGLPKIPLPKLNKIDHADYKEYYCSESKEIVETVYEEDFRNFDYKYAASF